MKFLVLGFLLSATPVFAQGHLPLKKLASASDAVVTEDENTEEHEGGDSITEEAMCLHNVKCGPEFKIKVDSKGCFHCVPKKKKN